MSAHLPAVQPITVALVLAGAGVAVAVGVAAVAVAPLSPWNVSVDGR